MAEAAKERVKKSEEASKKRMKEVERQVKEADDRDDAMFSNMKQQYKDMMDEKMKVIRADLNTTFDKRIGGIADNYEETHSVARTDQKMHILKTNKVIREVSRGLGANWRPVFRIVMKSFPLDTVGQAMDRIERHKPFIQAFRSLNTWREMKGEELDICDLVDALKDLGLVDLQHLAIQILESAGEDSLTRISYGQGIVSGSFSADDDSETKEEQTNGHSVEAQLSGILADRHLLHVAKRMGGEWQRLAKALEVSEEDVGNIMDSNPDEQQAAFQLLWLWRDNMSKSDQVDAASILTNALKSCGQADLVTELEERIKS
eukprot:GHVU01183088.1.p1 GENE.GHVU01183088.1~~GHVU01183088.1.p1  ORF type:complete len:339 (-),score=56.26 GHVU01183088.1:210-1163(-)